MLTFTGYILPQKKAVTAKYVNNLINKRFSKMLTSNKGKAPQIYIKISS